MTDGCFLEGMIGGHRAQVLSILMSMHINFLNREHKKLILNKFWEGGAAFSYLMGWLPLLDLSPQDVDS